MCHLLLNHMSHLNRLMCHRGTRCPFVGRLRKYMKKRGSILLRVFTTAYILCVLISSAVAQNTIGLVEYDSTNADGYVLYTPMSSKNTYLIDKCGKLIKKWTSSYLPGLSCYLLNDG